MWEAMRSLLATHTHTHAPSDECEWHQSACSLPMCLPINISKVKGWKTSQKTHSHSVWVQHSFWNRVLRDAFLCSKTTRTWNRAQGSQNTFFKVQPFHDTVVQKWHSWCKMLQLKTPMWCLCMWQCFPNLQAINNLK